MAKRDLVRLLVRLYGDPKLKERFEKDARKAMKAAKLSAKEQEILASGDEAAIRDYLGGNAPMATIVKTALSAKSPKKTKKK